MTVIPFNPIDQYVADWLASKSAKSGSEKTSKAYVDTMADFRAALAERGADLLSDPALVAMTAEQWAMSSKTGRTVKPATFNQRLAIVSSFYDFYGKKAVLAGRAIPNPISAVDRRKVQAYASAQPLNDLDKRLKAIDRNTLQGKRDYALLIVLAMTGRRLSEVASLKRENLVIQGKEVTIYFSKVKGGKEMKDLLKGKSAAVLLDWLQAYYGDNLDVIPPDSPLWVDLSHSAKSKGTRPISIKSVANICEKYLGTSKVHALRHTFAVLMERAGAPISEIQRRLGHESAATTSLYLEQLHSSENPHAGAIEDMLGVGD
jgi:integrase